jgi:hypothetical protein
MNASNHLHIDAMADYLADPHSADAKEIGLHLAQCAACRSQLNTMVAMKRHLPAIAGDAFDTALGTDGSLEQMLQSQTIERFVDGERVETTGQQVEEALSESPLALKAALHYASHTIAMDRALDSKDASSTASATTPRPAHGTSSRGFSLAAIKTWLSQRIPLWTALPAAAVATAILVLALTMISAPHGGRLQIATYQDNPVVQFRSHNRAPGIGFFGTAAKSSAPFESVTVEATAKEGITLSWPPVPQASAYMVRLARREKGGTVPLAERTTSATTVTFKGLEIIFDHRYVWTLSGKTTDKKDFYAEGGFVFHQ